MDPRNTVAFSFPYHQAPHRSFALADLTSYKDIRVQYLARRDDLRYSVAPFSSPGARDIEDAYLWANAYRCALSFRSSSIANIVLFLHFATIISIANLSFLSATGLISVSVAMVAWISSLLVISYGVVFLLKSHYSRLIGDVGKYTSSLEPAPNEVVRSLLSSKSLHPAARHYIGEVQGARRIILADIDALKPFTTSEVCRETL